MITPEEPHPIEFDPKALDKVVTSATHALIALREATETEEPDQP